MNYAVFDIESYKWIHFGCLGFFDGSDYKVFYSIRKFLSFLDSKAYRNFRIYAHNGGKFDFLFLLDDIIKLGWDYKIIERGGRVIAIYIDTGKTRFHFADSYALLPFSLKKLCESFKPEHYKGEYDYSTLRKNSFHSEKLLRYLENDCLSLFEIIQKFLSNEYIVNPKLTIASQSLDTFQHQFYESDLYRISLGEEELIRQKFYSGGRVEVYKGYMKKGYAYDINSLFPSVMLNKMPMGDSHFTHTFKKDKIGFYKVDLGFTPDFYISPLLIKRGSKFSHKNYFVKGAGSYYLCSETLKYLKQEFGINFKVNFGYYFQDQEYLFNDFVKTFYDLKMNAKDEVSRMIAKLFLNSLYGKFGQARWKESVEKINSNNMFEQFTEFSPEYALILVKKESHSKFIMPYIASYITELARLEHFKLMNQFSESQFYCDTDNMFTTQKYSTGKDIGELKDEGIFEGIFLGNKTYALRDKKTKEELITFKGFDVDQFSFKDFENALRNGKSLEMSKPDRILGFRECFNRKQGITDTAGFFLKTVTTNKIAKMGYDKRILIPDKKYVFDTKAIEYFAENENQFDKFFN